MPGPWQDADWHAARRLAVRPPFDARWAGANTGAGKKFARRETDRTPPGKEWRGAKPGGAKLRDTPAYAKAREAPSLDDYARSTISALVQAPGGTVDFATKAVPELVSQAGDYLGSHSLGEMASDAGGLLKQYGGYWADNPIGAAADLVPFVGDVKGVASTIDEAARARHAGDPELAQMLERYTAPGALVGLVPEAGIGLATAVRSGVRRLAGRGAATAAEEAGGAAAREAEREALLAPARTGPSTPDITGPWKAPLPATPAALQPRVRFNVSDEGGTLNVARQGVQPRLVPEAEGAPLPVIRHILKTPEGSGPLDAAQAYARGHLGRDYDPNAPAPQTSLAKQAGIGAAYREMVGGSPDYKHALFERYGETMPEVVERTGAQNYDQLTEAAYNQLGREVDAQFASLPVSMRFHQGEGEYATPSAMMQDVLARGNLNVFRGGDPHPMLNDIDVRTRLNPNEKFRAVHDFYGHVLPGTTFRAGGEEAAYGSHSQLMSPLAQMALLTETRGQNSLVNYSPLNADLTYRMAQARDELEELALKDRMGGNFGKAGRAERRQELNAALREMGGETQFAPQVPGLLPPEYLDPYTAGGVPDYLQRLIQPRAATDNLRAVHLSSQPELTATDPSFYGTGHRGDDWRTRASRGDLANHTSFYVGPTGTVRPEGVVADVSPHAYETTLGGLYDINADPEGLVKLARSANMASARKGVPDAHVGDLTRLVRDYGYQGYLNPEFLPGQGAANVLYPVGGLKPITRGAYGYAAGGAVGG